MRKRYPCTLEKACFVKWLVKVMGWSQTETAIVLGLNVGSVSVLSWPVRS